MWIKIKDPSGEHLLQTSFDVAVGGDPDYAFMNEWDIQRIRAYCRERSLTLEEDVQLPKQPPVEKPIEEVLNSILGGSVTSTGIVPEGICNSKDDLITSVRECVAEFDWISPEFIREEIYLAMLRGVIDNSTLAHMKQVVDVLLCPLHKAGFYSNKREPVATLAKRRLELNK